MIISSTSGTNRTRVCVHSLRPGDPLVLASFETSSGLFLPSLDRPHRTAQPQSRPAPLRLSPPSPLAFLGNPAPHCCWASALSAGRTIERSRRDGNARTFNCHSANHALWSDFGTLLDRPLPQTRGFHSVPSRLIHHQRHLLLLSLPLLHLSVPLVLLLALVMLLLYNDKSVRRTGSRIGDIPSAEKRGVFYSGVK